MEGPNVALFIRVMDLIRGDVQSLLGHDIINFLTVIFDIYNENNVDNE